MLVGFKRVKRRRQRIEDMIIETVDHSSSKSSEVGKTVGDTDVGTDGIVHTFCSGVG